MAAGDLAGGDRKVAAEGVELGRGASGVDGLQAVLQLVGVQPPCDRVLVELVDKALTILVGGA